MRIVRDIVVLLAMLLAPWGAAPAIAAWWWPFGAQEKELAAPPAEVQVLLDALELQLQLKPKVGRIVQRGDVVMLHDVRLFEVKVQGRPLLTARARLVELKEIAADAQGLVRFRQVVAHDVSFGEGAGERTVRLFVPRLELGEVSLLKPGAGRDARERLAEMVPLMAAGEIAEMRIAIGEMQPLTLRGLKWRWAGDRRTGTGETSVDFGTLMLPLRRLLEQEGRVDAQTLESLQALKLEELQLGGKLNMRSVWVDEERLSGNLTLELGARNAGFLLLRLQELMVPRRLLEEQRRARDQAPQQWPPAAEELPQQRRNGTAGVAPPGGMGGMPGMFGGGLPSRQGAVRTLEALGGMRLKALELGWRDTGLARRWVAWEAQQQGLSTAQFVRRQVVSLQAQLATLGLPADKLEKLGLAVERFLNEPRELRISLQAREALGIGDVLLALVMPALLLDKLQMQVFVNGVPVQ